MNFEDQLREALRRQEPSSGFTDRVMARIPAAEPWWRRRGLAVAAGVMVVLMGGASYQFERVQRERRAAEQAKAEFAYALELTSEKLQFTETILRKHMEKR